MDITESTVRYEAWLRQELGAELVQGDLDRKHARMAADPFPFLRATYWRWAETILDCCPTLAKAETVLGVGDIHLENFGTWHDADGRLVWGINDYDEAAAMPWPLDLVRLATSGVLAGGKPGPRWVAALQAALPPGARILHLAPRTAGTGSLGRPRWVALAEWRGGLVAREAKAVVASGWVLPPDRGHRAIRSLEAATSAFRVPDPWYGVADHIAVRRLSPSNRKIEVAKDPGLLLAPAMLTAMGHEIASLHRANSAAKPLCRQLDALPGRWLKRAAEAAADMTKSDFQAWKRAQA